MLCCPCAPHFISPREGWNMLPLKVMCPISVQAVTNLSPPRLFTIHPSRDNCPFVLQPAWLHPFWGYSSSEPPAKGKNKKKKKKGKKRKTRGGSKNIFVSCVRFCSPHMIHLSCFTMIWLKSPKMACLKELNTKKYCSLNHESRCIPVGLPGITKHASWDNLMFLPHCHDMKSHSAKATLQRRYNGL